MRWLLLLALVIVAGVALYLATLDETSGDAEPEHIVLILGGIVIGFLLGVSWTARRL
jgi:hypothetical protein